MKKSQIPKKSGPQKIRSRKKKKKNQGQISNSKKIGSVKKKKSKFDRKKSGKNLIIPKNPDLEKIPKSLKKLGKKS